MKKKAVKIDEYYEVFARETVEEPLTHLGCHPAPNEEMAVAQALMTYSEKPYIEMCVVRRDDIKQVLPMGKDLVGFA